MPQPENHDLQNQFKDQFRTPPQIPDFREKNLEEKNVASADSIASKELGKLAVFLLREFPDETASGKSAVEVTIDILTKLNQQLRPSEALFGFMSWLTIRQEEVTFSRHHEASIAVELLKKFIDVQKLSNPRENYTKYLKSMSGLNNGNL
jgi:hypothetical protein